MRFVALVTAALWLSACGARGSEGPAWPKAAERETDGGESIAPREASTAVAAVEKGDDAEDDVVDLAKAAVTATASTTAATPAATTSAPIVTVDEDTIMIEEIVIEISDDAD